MLLLDWLVVVVVESSSWSMLLCMRKCVFESSSFFLHGERDFRHVATRLNGFRDLDGYPHQEPRYILRKGESSS